MEILSDEDNKKRKRSLFCSQAENGSKKVLDPVLNLSRDTLRARVPYGKIVYFT